MKIDRVDIYPLDYPTTGFFKFFSTPHGHTGRPTVVVKLRADDGTIGWGQSVPVSTWTYETLETSTLVLREYFAPVLIGRDPRDIPGALDALDQVIRPGFSTGMPLTRAGIDLALHDLLGKFTHRSLAQMWNRPQEESLELSWTVNVRKLDELDATLAEGCRRGYRHFNVKVAPDPTFDLEVVRRVREAAPDSFLWIDANAGYDPDTALAVAPKLADQGVAVLESPLPPNRLSGYQALRRQGALPILMDEGVVSPVELREFIRLEMLDGVAMKPARCGGLLSNRQQIELCLEHDLVWLGSGLCDPDIALAASLGLYGAFGLQAPAALNAPQFLDTSVLEKPLRIDGSVATIPDGPGLGVTVDEEKLRVLSERTCHEWKLAPPDPSTSL